MEPPESDLDGVGTRDAAYAIHRAGAVQQTLRNSSTSLSAMEIATRTELSESEVEKSLSILGESDTVLEEHERYEVNYPTLLRSPHTGFAR